MSELSLNCEQKNLNIYKFVWDMAKVRWVPLFLFVIFNIAHYVLGVFVAQYFNKSMINQAYLLNLPFYSAMFYVVMYAFFQNLQFLDNNIMFKLDFNSVVKIKKNLRNNLYSYVIQHSMDYFNNSFSGSLNHKISSVVNDAAKLIELINNFISKIIITIIVLFLYLNINVYIALSFFVISTIYIISLTKLRKMRKEKVKKVAESKNKYFALINDDFTNIGNIKIFSNEKIEIHNVRRVNNEILRSGYNFLKVAFISSLVNFIFCFVFIFSILGVSGYMLATKKIDIGDFMFITIITSIFRFNIDDVVKKLASFAETTGRLENNIADLAKPIEITNKADCKKLVLTQGRIVFRNVKFGYKKGGKNAK